MKKRFWIIGVLIFCASLAACSRQQERNVEAGKKGIDSDKEMAIQFLQGIQEGDKNKMYLASNLTPEMVNDSRDKLVHSNKYKLTDQQRKELEYILRLSGQIDFFLKKTRVLFPKSSRSEITQSIDHGSLDDVRRIEHLVKMTYSKKEDAIRDKKGKQVKEMILHLQQLTRSVAGRSVHTFTFSGTDFERIADREFEVLSYF